MPTENKFRPAPTCTLDLLKEAAAYERFRRLMYDLSALNRNMARMIDTVARHFGVSKPQHTIIITVAHLQSRGGATVQAVAESMRVASPFVVTQSGLLADMGLIAKRGDRDDKRKTLLLLTKAGESYVKRSTPVIQGLNNVVFRPLDQANFTVVSETIHAVAATSDQALEMTRMLALARE